MKRLLLICLFLIGCTRAQKSPLDPSSSNGRISFLLRTIINSSSSSTSSSSLTPTLSYNPSSYVSYIGESVSIIANSSNVSSCTVSPSLPSGLTLSGTTCNITGTPTSSSSNATYTITAKNGNNSVSSTLSLTISPIYRTYITSVPVAANITLTTADSTCNSNGNKPNSSTYKAMLVTSTRRACSSSYCNTSGSSENLDWVFKANSAYFQSNGTTLVGKTNSSGIFTSSFNSYSISLNSSFSNSSFNYWTGLNTDYTTNSSNNCSNWTSNAGGSNGTTGFSTSTIENAFSFFTFACSNTNYLLCIEQ
ncbi:MAG TPA: DUF1554 domain-containing protein [Leptospiraceae bacterium]|nr:DUF1554 domain-containing protein [Leptospiraceae bacterium]HMY33522.1 DUF1554 domain-containing protein [Leptospiraceae bacterium]HMZ66109.1 DUF1554 domain-containing protein [Leptospiraceae bacterium]HNC01136.1 DUF1554 domain-containing protein [Leptospiraceae bacterium]HNC59667.1 DUF1554 domain-containing protein [Leptospiraceae bacterium]